VKSLFVRLALTALPLLSSRSFGQTIAVPENLWNLEQQEDTDGDHRITVHDRISPYDLRDRNNAPIRTVANVYTLSALLQELKRADDRRQLTVEAKALHLNESAADRTHRLIREMYWDALTRRIDADHIDQVVHDSKSASKYDYIYVPASDETAVKYFKGIEQAAAREQRSPALKVVALPRPEEVTGSFVRNLDGAHGILSLKLELDSHGKPVRGAPYVVPGGRFNELYYWDSYFIVLGLLQDGRTDLARGMTDNFLYALEHYGRIPNANRTYYLTRSQPPFLTSMIRAVYDAGAGDREWLKSALTAAAAEYRNVWLGPDHVVQIGRHRLSRYYDTGSGPCPEVEPGHYDEKLQPWLAQAKSATGAPLTSFRFLNDYRYCGNYADLTVNGLTLDAFFKHDRAVRESGHDTTHRFDDRTADFVSVDLNSLLYKYETDFAELLEKEFGGSLAALGEPWANATWWRQQAELRRQAMMQLMWDDARGFFFDYDFVRKQRSTYISATGLYPLWAKILNPNDPADRLRVDRLALCMRQKLEQPAGLAASARESVVAAHAHDPRQWDYPYGWPPHQILAWQGLRNYGLHADAGRLAYRWLYTIARNAHDYNGTIPEKYNVVTGSHDVFVEYGNVGTKFSYIAPEGFGWMNASFELGFNSLSPAHLAALRRLDRPDSVPKVIERRAAASAKSEP
jgi:alpha,alpha-trehalase